MWHINMKWRIPQAAKHWQACGKFGQSKGWQLLMWPLYTRDSRLKESICDFYGPRAQKNEFKIHQEWLRVPAHCHDLILLEELNTNLKGTGICELH